MQLEADDGTAGDGQGDGADENEGRVGGDNQADGTTVKAAVAKAAPANAAGTSDKTEIPHQSEV